jgi:hypothetical protein
VRVPSRSFLFSRDLAFRHSFSNLGLRVGARFPTRPDGITLALTISPEYLSRSTGSPSVLYRKVASHFITYPIDASARKCPHSSLPFPISFGQHASMKYFLSSPMTSRLNFWQAILPIGYGSQFTVVHARNSYLLSSGRCASFQGRKGQKALAMHWG